ncbi:MAG: hypothetical protein IJ308_04025 [Clostridia bacterium]|nr:hypothetical protein [Clostridia bacterium]
MVISKINVKGSPVTCLNSSSENRIKEITVKKKYRGKLVNSQTYHFAEKSEVAGESSVICENAVSEPIRSLQVEGNTVQDGEPTPSAPVEIMNASPLTVKVYGSNLTQVSESTSLNVSLRFVVEAGKAYTLSFEALGRGLGVNIYIQSGDRWFTDGTLQTISGGAYTGYFKRTFTPTQSGYVWINGYLYTDGSFTRYFNIRLNEGSADFGFEPYYEPQSVAIPSTLTLSDGSTLEMTFAKIDDSADRLVVDTVNKKVAYESRTKELVLKGTEVWSRTSGGLALFNIDPKGATTEYKGFCNYYIYDMWRKMERCVSLYGNALYVVDSNYDTTDTTSPERFNSWLADRYAEGNPMRVVYKIATPITTDITDTDLGKSLLSLCTYDGTTIVEASGEGPTSQLTVSYWKQI